MPKARLLPSGRYRTQVIDHYDYVEKDGKTRKVPRYASFTSTQTGMKGKRESEAMANDFLLGRRQRKTHSKTLRESIDEYIDDHKNVLSPATINGYNWMKRFAFTDIMDMDISKLNTRTLVAAVNKEMLRPNTRKKNKSIISAKTVKNEWGLLSATLNYFDIDYNANKIPLPKIPKKYIDLPDPADIIAVIRGTDIELPCLLAMWLSLSESELAGLTKSKSLLDNGKYLAVQDVVLHINGKAVYKETGKTDTRIRVLKLHPYLLNMINCVPTDQIIPMLPQTIYRKFVRYMKNAGMKPITFHQLRHVNASVMAQLCIPDKYAQERGGWSSDSVMKKTYMHTFSAGRIATDKKIDQYFSTILFPEEKISHEISHEIEKAL